MATKKSKIRSSTSIVGNILTFVLMLFVVVISLYPILWVFVSSFKTRMDILNSPLKFPNPINLQGYTTVLFSTPILTYFKNSIIIVTISTFLNVLFVGMAAYVVARYDFRFKNLIIVMFVSTLYIPTIAISLPVYNIVRYLGLYNTKGGLVFVYTVLPFAMTFLILRSYIIGIPKELDEAALIDGAGYTRIFFQIIVPVAEPGIMAAAILAFLGNWNEFYYALLLTSSDTSRTIAVMIFNFTSQFKSNLASEFASVILIIAPTIIIYCIGSEQLVKSMTLGAVKG